MQYTLFPKHDANNQGNNLHQKKNSQPVEIVRTVQNVNRESVKRVFISEYSCLRCQHFFNCEVRNYTDVVLSSSNCDLFLIDKSIKPLK